MISFNYNVCTKTIKVLEDDGLKPRVLDILDVENATVDMTWLGLKEILACLCGYYLDERKMHDFKYEILIFSRGKR